MNSKKPRFRVSTGSDGTSRFKSVDYPGWMFWCDKSGVVLFETYAPYLPYKIGANRKMERSTDLRFNSYHIIKRPYGDAK